MSTATITTETTTPFGANLRRIRLAQRLPLRTLATMAGISYSVTGQYERGCRNPSPAAVARLAAALGVTVADLTAEGQGPALYLPLPKGRMVRPARRSHAERERLFAEHADRLSRWLAAKYYHREWVGRWLGREPDAWGRLVHEAMVCVWACTGLWDDEKGAFSTYAAAAFPRRLRNTIREELGYQGRLAETTVSADLAALVAA